MSSCLSSSHLVTVLRLLFDLLLNILLLLFVFCVSGEVRMHVCVCVCVRLSYPIKRVHHRWMEEEWETNAHPELVKRTLEQRASFQGQQLVILSQV